jgi:hypothetical protein
MRKFLLPFLMAMIVNVVIGQQKTIYVKLINNGNQLNYGSDAIKKAASQKNWGYAQSNSALSIIVASDSKSVKSIAENEALSLPDQFNWQGYHIRVATKSKQKIIYILSADETGAMYGCLDIAEAIRLETVQQITNSDHKPFMERRGIKFNIPLDLRTPSYTDPSDASQQNIPNVWETDFWVRFLDQMVTHRYNVLTLWNLHPFPSMVKVPEFPEVALNDVWRTKEKLGDDFSHSGLNYVRPNMLANHEVVKKISIDQKITFWKDVMRMANDRGIEVYVFTWNIFVNGAEGKHGIVNKQDNDTTIRYFRAAVREMVKTYPLLAGIGITAGESMNHKLQGKYTNENWLASTYGEGIKDALKENPKRDFRLIHRFHQTSLSEINSAFSTYPGTIDLSLKYAIAHMYSIPNPPFILPAMPLLSKTTRSWLTIRNDDIYSFRWGNNNFARQFIKSIPEPEKIAGYYMGPDGYCWGLDYLTKGNEHPLILEKQWYSFMLWGRLGYDPDLSDDIFLKTLQARFPQTPVKKIYQPWSASSMIFPWITRLVWGDIDLKWFPEANISHPTHKGFYTVGEYTVREPMPGSNIRNIYLWAGIFHEGIKDSLLSPMAVADTLSRLSLETLNGLKALPSRNSSDFSEMNQMLADMESFAHIGNYYAAKIRAACHLALFDRYADQSDKNKAVAYLKEAKLYWAQYASVYDLFYKPALYNRVGFVDIPGLMKKVDEDITMAENWIPGSIKYQLKPTTEVPFRK